MGAVSCPEHGRQIGALVSDTIIQHYSKGLRASPIDIRRFEVDMGDPPMPFWADSQSMMDAGLPVDRALTPEEFFDAKSLGLCPVCPDCARRWLRENNIDPKRVGLE